MVADKAEFLANFLKVLSITNRKFTQKIKFHLSTIDVLYPVAYAVGDLQECFDQIKEKQQESSHSLLQLVLLFDVKSTLRSKLEHFVISDPGFTLLSRDVLRLLGFVIVDPSSNDEVCEFYPTDLQPPANDKIQFYYLDFISNPPISDLSSYHPTKPKSTLKTPPKEACLIFVFCLSDNPLDDFLKKLNEALNQKTVFVVSTLGFLDLLDTAGIKSVELASDDLSNYHVALQSFKLFKVFKSSSADSSSKNLTVSEVQMCEKGEPLSLTIDVETSNPENIKMNADQSSNTPEILANSEDLTRRSFIKQQFTAKLPLPTNTVYEKICSAVNASGILTILVPRRPTSKTDHQPSTSDCDLSLNKFESQLASDNEVKTLEVFRIQLNSVSSVCLQSSNSDSNLLASQND